MEKKQKFGGRKKGSKNKITRTVKDSMLKAFNKMQKDPSFNLFAWGKANPTDFYKIAARLIPTEVKNNISGSVELYKVWEGIDKSKIFKKQDKEGK